MKNNRRLSLVGQRCGYRALWKVKHWCVDSINRMGKVSNPETGVRK